MLLLIILLITLLIILLVIILIILRLCGCCLFSFSLIYLLERHHYTKVFRNSRTTCPMGGQPHDCKSLAVSLQNLKGDPSGRFHTKFCSCNLVTDRKLHESKCWHVSHFDLNWEIVVVLHPNLHAFLPASHIVLNRGFCFPGVAVH